MRARHRRNPQHFAVVFQLAAPTGEATWVSFQHSVAMAQSSSARITRTRIRESAPEISASSEGRAFSSRSSLIPRNPKVLQAAARTSGEFSPTPAVNTSASVPQMACNQFQRRWIAVEQLSGASGAVLMIDAMKSVAADVVLEPLIRTGINCRRQWHVPMKAGIENGDLRNRSQDALDNLHTLHFGANMQRCKRGHAGNGRAYLGRNGDRLLETRPAVNDAMSYNIDLRNRSQSTHSPVTQRAQQPPDGLLTPGALDLFFLGDSLRVLNRNGSGAVAKLDPALPQASCRMIRESRSNFVQAGFLTARTAVEYENFH